MNDVMNRTWGADKVVQEEPVEAVVEAAKIEFMKRVGREPVSNDEMVEFFMESHHEASKSDGMFDGLKVANGE